MKLDFSTHQSSRESDPQSIVHQAMLDRLLTGLDAQALIHDLLDKKAKNTAVTTGSLAMGGVQAVVPAAAPAPEAWQPAAATVPAPTPEVSQTPAAPTPAPARPVFDENPMAADALANVYRIHDNA